MCKSRQAQPITPPDAITVTLVSSIRQLIKDLENAGFVNRGGKASHQNFLHGKGVTLTISGKPGDDAKPYQEKLIRQKIKEVK